MARYDGITALDLSRLRDELLGEIDRRALANPGVDAKSTSVRSGDATPPRVSGISPSTVFTQPGTFTVKWNAAAINDLQRYEVQISTTADFTQDVVTDSTRNLHYTWNEGDVDTTYYLRVRAVNTKGNAGPWSSRISSATGKVATATIVVNAASEIDSFTQSTGFSQLQGTGSVTTETYGPVEISVFDDNSVVDPVIVFEVDYRSDYYAIGTNQLFVELLRRPAGGTSDTVIDDVTTDFKSTIPNIAGVPTGNTARTTVDVGATKDQPGEGDFEYRIRLTITSSGGSTGGNNDLWIRGIDLNMEFTQSKR